MKLKITYPTKERKYITKHMFQNVTKSIELEPVKIYRTPCGTGKAANRYYYSAYFKAPEDAEFVANGMISEPINRKDNPRFNPKQLKWEGSVCEHPNESNSK